MSKIEMTTGKLRTAIKMLLLFAFAAMHESRVSDAANPNDVNRITIENSEMSATGFFKSKMKRKNPVKESNAQRMKL